MVTVVRFKSCTRCGGDLRPDEDEWRCWQCGQTHYSRQDAIRIREEAKNVLDPPPKKRGHSFGSAGDHSRTIDRRNRAEQRFWEANRRVLQLFAEGKTAKEVAALDGRSERRLLRIRKEAAELQRAAPFREVGDE